MNDTKTPLASSMPSTQIYKIAIILLILGCSTSLAMLSGLSRELIGEGLISIDEQGMPTAECMVYKNGTSTAQTCSITAGFGVRSVGCFAVWTHSGLIQQGCYSGQELSLRDQCRKGVCAAENRRDAVTFCCCHGPLCNAEFI